MRRCGVRRALTATASCRCGVWTAGTSRAWRWSARSRAGPVKATKPRQRRFVKARRFQNSSTGFGEASELTPRDSGRHGWLDLQGVALSLIHYGLPVVARRTRRRRDEKDFVPSSCGFSLRSLQSSNRLGAVSESPENRETQPAEVGADA